MTVKSNSLSTAKVQPFLKWVGGKRALLPELLKHIPVNFGNYFEPFVGGGALFFELKKLGRLEGKKAYLFDKNSELINTYIAVRDKPMELLEKLEHHQESHSKEYYYEVRAHDREPNFAQSDTIERAARFIYLNKTCFNGLYRVNSKGFHNVPMGSYKKPNIHDEALIYGASEALQGAIIEVADFAKTTQLAQSGDFVYFDPPYYPLSPTSSFTSYHTDLFLDEEQKRLYEVFDTLVHKKVSVLHSNSDTDFIKNLYREYVIEHVEMARFINSKSNGRGKIKEVLIKKKSSHEC